MTSQTHSLPVPNLTFIVPIRHPATVPDWGAVKARIAETLASLAAQTTDNWDVVLIANHEADLPALPTRARVVRVDLPPPPPLLPDHKLEDLYEQIRTDKGRRVLLGLLATRPSGFVMTVDYDDFVSNRLAALVATHPEANGWFVSSGYLYDSSDTLLRYPEKFNEFCGTSIIVRADLLQIPATEADATDSYTRHQLGSHISIKGRLAAAGTPLQPVPFAGAVYRVGYRGSSTSTGSIRDTYFQRWQFRKDPMRFLRNALRLKRLSPAILDEFFGGNRGPRVG